MEERFVALAEWSTRYGLDRLTAIFDFFARNGQESFLHFWQNAPLRDPAFWHTYWASLWTRDSQMSFLSFTFWIFLAICALAYYLCPKFIKPVWLLLCSYAFYLYDRHGTALVFILVAATVVTYLCGLGIGLLKNRAARLVLLWLAVIACIGTLGYYKYSNFFAQLVGLEVTASLPAILGLSYFIFQSLGYVIDVYQEVVPAERNPIYYALYVSFFPCIVSGPIERAGHLLPQLRAPRGFNYDRVAGGLFRMLWGAFKKLVIAGNLDVFTRAVFTDMESYSGVTLAVAALVFSYQLYMDFSGYCDLALGAGQVLGYDLLENFDRPFAGRSYTQLWDRWHISLTSWFRDYLFTPLSFVNRGLSGIPGKLQGWFNIFIIFPVSGLWHGANMGYVVWGVLNGLFMVVGKATAKARRKLAKKNLLYKLRFLKALIQCSIVYLLFTFCIVFFAASFYGGQASDGFYLLTHLTAAGPALSALPELLDLNALTLYVVGGGVVLVEALEFFGRPHEVIRKLWFPFRWILYYGLIIAILLVANFGASGFVYGEF